jgi:radical SAM superfamily enzyme YgiQ (UPF0313 family)
VRILLVSTYDLGRQPFGLASPAAWLRAAGHHVTALDLAVDPPSFPEVDRAAFYLPMHTATRLAAPWIERIAKAGVRTACYGLYAPLNADFLRSRGAEAVFGGEFEQDLLDWVNGRSPAASKSIPKLNFLPPDRSTLPAPSRYAQLIVQGEARLAGSTDASRGCKHLCRHCPVVPVYQGAFRVVPVETVLADIRQQVRAGVQHISFGDPDFFNGPTHARRIVTALAAEFPGLTYDATIKVEHLLRHRALLPVLRDTGCLFVTSAFESFDDQVLVQLAKGHTRADALEAIRTLRAEGLGLSPTFIAFTPWTTRDSYRQFLDTLLEQDLAGQTAPMQLALRLLIPAGSLLLGIPAVQSCLQSFDPRGLLWTWRHPDPAMDVLAEEVMGLVLSSNGASRSQTFASVYRHVFEEPLDLTDRATIPYLNEPWYC